MIDKNEFPVFMLRAKDDLKNELRRLLTAIWGDQKPWTKAREVIIKPNAVNFEPHVFVEPKVIGALVSVLKEDGAKVVNVAESCTNGSFTRLVFQITGIRKEVEEAGGRCVYLDEGPAITKELGKAGRIEVSQYLAQTLIDSRPDYFYIDLAKLKTHSMTTVTLCLKNQWGFVDPKFRGGMHNDFLHAGIAEVYKLFVPDLCIVEGLMATNHGHFPLRGFEDETLWKADVLIGGRNTVAVDAACCRLIRIDPQKVEHIALCAQSPEKLDPKVELLDPIDPVPMPFTDAFHPFFPKGVTIHKGKERCCKEGCFSNPYCAVQVLATNYDGGGSFDIFMGKGHEQTEVDACNGPALVVGPCAEEEVYDRLVARLGRKNVRLSSGHNNLKETLRHLIPLMGVGVFKASPLPLYKLAWIFIRHKLAGSRADIGFF